MLEAELYVRSMHLTKHTPHRCIINSPDSVIQQLFLRSYEIVSEVALHVHIYEGAVRGYVVQSELPGDWGQYSLATPEAVRVGCSLYSVT